MQTPWQNLRVRLQIILKRLTFTLLLSLALGIGIGANIAFWGFIHAAPRRPSALDNADRLVMVWNIPGNIPDESGSPQRANLQRRPLRSNAEAQRTDRAQAIYPAQTLHQSISEVISDSHSQQFAILFFAGIALLVGIIRALV